MLPNSYLPMGNTICPQEMWHHTISGGWDETVLASVRIRLRVIS